MNAFSVETPQNYERIFRLACAAGTEAGTALIPPLMIVVDRNKLQHAAGRSELGGLWFETEGPAGAALITIQPATEGFCRWLLKEGHARRGVDRPGIYLHADCASQSIYRAAAYALAFAAVIGRAGFGIRAEVVLWYD